MNDGEYTLFKLFYIKFGVPYRLIIGDDNKYYIEWCFPTYYDKQEITADQFYDMQIARSENII